MVSKPFSFRLPDEVVQFIESSQHDGETLNQTAQRLLIDLARSSNALSTSLHTGVDIKELVKQEIEASLAEMRSQFEAQLEELRGKLKAR